MHQVSTVWEFLILLVLLFLVCVVGRPLKLPDSIAYILGGVMLAVLGPQGLGIFNGETIVIWAGEIGVGVILFEAGLELSTDRLRQMLKPLVLGGIAQMVLTAAFGALAYNLAFGGSLSKAIFVGILLGPSSTPIILAKLRDSGRLHAPIGTSTLGILVAQDMSLLPLSFLIPIMAGKSGSDANDLLKIVGGIVAVLIVYGAEATTMGRLLDWCVRRRDRRLFFLAVIILVIGMAATAHAIGLSAVLGVFLVGIMLSGSSHIADLMGHLEEWTFVGSMFFVATGFLLDFRFVGNPANLPLLLFSIVGAVFIKFLTGYVTGRLLGHGRRSSLRLAGYLSHIGEMAFLMTLLGHSLGIINGADKDAFFTITIATMLLSPLVSLVIERACDRIDPNPMEPEFEVLHLNQAPLDDHFIVVGYGRVGKSISKDLKSLGIRVVVVEIDLELLEEARSAGFEAILGESHFRSVLHESGIETAKALVLTFAEVGPLATTIAEARRLNPNISLHIRLRMANQIPRMNRAISHPELITIHVDEDFAAPSIAAAIMAKEMVTA